MSKKLLNKIKNEQKECELKESRLARLFATVEEKMDITLVPAPNCGVDYVMKNQVPRKWRGEVVKPGTVLGFCNLHYVMQNVGDGILFPFPLKAYKTGCTFYRHLSLYLGENCKTILPVRFSIFIAAQDGNWKWSFKGEEKGVYLRESYERAVTKNVCVTEYPFEVMIPTTNCERL